MSKAHIMNEVHIGQPIGSGGTAAPDHAAWLRLAAAPTFAAMGLWNGFFAPHPDVICMAMQASPLSGMTIMYLLMSAFHLSPWLKLISRH